MTRSRQKTPPPQPISGWMWLLIGFALGIATAFGLQTHNSQGVDNRGAKVQGPAQRAGAADGGAPRHFDFYTLLPELKVLDSDPQTSPQPSTHPSPPAAAASPAPARPASNRGAGRYLLQAGSFQKYQQADRMKAHLALLGVQADIRTVNVDDSTWHRVRIGPFADVGRVKALRKRLHHNQIDTLLVKAPR